MGADIYIYQFAIKIKHMLYCYRVYITEISYLVRNNIFAINSSSQLHLVFNITIKLCEACHYRKGQNLENRGRGDGST